MVNIHQTGDDCSRVNRFSDSKNKTSQKQKEEMRTKNLTARYVLLIVLTLAIFLLIILFNMVTYAKPGENPFGLPSIGLWKPLEDASKITNLSENESLIEKNKQSETPSDAVTIKETFKKYWVSYIILLLIIALVILWVIMVFKIHNG